MSSSTALSSFSRFTKKLDFLKSFSPSEMRKNWEDEKFVAEVAAQIYYLRGKSDSFCLQQFVNLESTFGERVLKKAMSAEAWQSLNHEEDASFFEVTTPAMTLLDIANMEVAQKLAKMVPSDHWNHKIKLKESSLKGLYKKIENDNHLTFMVYNMGPLEYLCYQAQNITLNHWLKRLDLLKDHIVSPSLNEIYICRSFLDKDTETKQAFNAFIEKWELEKHVLLKPLPQESKESVRVRRSL